MKRDKLKIGSILSKCKQWNRLYTMKVLAFVTIVCGLIGSYMYYLPFASKLIDEAERLPMWKVLIATLFSTLKLYMAAPTVSLTENVNIYYEIARFVAPIYTASIGVQIFKKTSLNAWNSFLSIGKKRIFVYGYNQQSIVFMNNVIDDQKKNSVDKLKVILLVDDSLSDKERIDLLVSGVIIKNINFEMTSIFETAVVSKKLNIKKRDVFVLMHKVDEKNLGLLLKIKEHVRTYKDGYYVDLKCRVLCENYGIKSMIINLDKECKTIMDIKTFSIAELGVQGLFSSEEGLIFKESATYDPEKLFDVRMMILGFGKVGQELLAQAISNSVISIDNNIEFDVFDSDMEEKRELFLHRFHHNMIKEVGDVNKKTVSYVLTGIDEGEFKVRMNFHSYNIRKSAFKQAVETFASQVTYVALCFDDVENIVRSLDGLRQCLTNENVPIAIRMSSSKLSLDYIMSEFKEFHNIFSFCTEKDILDYENILNEELDKSAVESYMQYEKISDMYSNESAKDDMVLKGKWIELSDFYKNSNRAQVLHKNIKKKYLGVVNKTQNLSDLIAGIPKDQAAYQYIIQKKELMNLAQIEHRRWSYHLIQSGYEFCNSDEFQSKLTEYAKKPLNGQVGFPKNIKDEFKEVYRIHDLLITWESLVSNVINQKPYILFYDLIPWMILEKK